MAIITNTASASMFSNGEEVATASNTAVYDLTEAADATLTKSPETGTIIPGQPFPITLTLTNTGDTALYNITLRDSIDPALTVVPDSVYVNGVQLDSQYWSFVDGVLVISPQVTLNPGDSLTATFSVQTD